MWHRFVFKSWKQYFSLWEVTVCCAKVKISRFNPAFVVPEEHLESLKEHIHRCWVHMLCVHSQYLQPCKKGASAVRNPKDTTLSQTITSQSRLGEKNCFCTSQLGRGVFVCRTQRHRYVDKEPVAPLVAIYGLYTSDWCWICGSRA